MPSKAQHHPDEEKTSGMARLTISLPYSALQRVNAIAEQMDVSAAWVVRKAIQDFVDRDMPLFREQQ